MSSSIGTNLINLVKAVDDSTLEFRNSKKDTQDALDKNDTFGFAQAILQSSKSVTQTADYTQKAVVNLGSSCAPQSVVMALSSVEVVLGISGIITVLSLMIQSFSIHRQTSVIAAFPENGKVNEDNFKQTLVNLSVMNSRHFEKALPDHFKQELQSEIISENKNIIAHLQNKTDTSQVIATLNATREYVERKRIFHIVALIGSIVALGSTIGLMLGCPPLFLTILCIVGIGLTVSGVALSKGWVDHTDVRKGFSLVHYLPETIQQRFFREHTRLLNEQNSMLVRLPTYGTGGNVDTHSLDRRDDN